MKYELWYSKSEGSYVLFLTGNRSADQLVKTDAQVIWTVEAVTYKEALQKGDDFLRLSMRQSGGAEVSRPGVWWNEDEVCLVDQRPLPSRDEIIQCKTFDDVVIAIRTAQACRMPETACVAGYGMALAAREIVVTNKGWTDAEMMLRHLRDAKAVLDATRPEDLDLAGATKRILDAAETFYNDHNYVYIIVELPSGDEIAAIVIEEAHAIAAAYGADRSCTPSGIRRSVA